LLLSTPGLSAVQEGDANGQPDVATLTMQFAASRAAREAELDQRIALTLREVDRIDRERRAEARRRARAEADLARERSSREAIERQAAAREQFFLQRDQIYLANLALFEALLERIDRVSPDLARQVTAYRALITDFVATASPERLALIQRYIQGDPQALSLLQALIPIENAARTAAAQEIAEGASRNARRANAHSYRVLGLLALDSFNRGYGGLAIAIQAWESVLAEERTRLDLLVRARLASLVADDLSAAQLMRAAQSLSDDAEMNSRYPLAAFFVAADASEPGSIAAAAAQFLRNPPSTEGVPFQTRPDVPAPDTRLAPLLDSMSRCERSIADAELWTETRELADVDRRVRQMAGRFAVGAPAQPPAGARPNLNCTDAAAALAVTLNDATYSAAHREGLLPAALDLADRLARTGGETEAQILWRSAAVFCPTAPAQGRSTMVQLSCVTAQLMSASRGLDAGASLDGAELERVTRAIDQLDVAHLAPEMAAAVSSTYILAADVFERAGNLSAARRMLQRGRAGMSRFARSFREAATLELTDIDLADAEARLHARQADSQAADGAFRQVETRLVGFYTAHPHSLGVCESVRDHAESDLAWRTAASTGGGVEKLRRLTPILDACDRLWRDLFPGQMWPNRSLGLRQELAYELASARLDGGDFDQAEVAFSYLAEISSDAFSDIPSPTSFSAHIVSLAALSRIAVHAERYRDAVEYEVRAVALARRRHLPHYEIPHLGRLADLRARLADIAGADAASIEAVKLCAVLIEEDGEDDESLSIDRVIESVAAIACHSGIRNVVGHFEQDVVALETQSAAASPTRVLDLADALFFLGQARRSIYDLTGAREAYRRSVELREQMPNAFSVATGRTDLTPYAIARLAGFPGEESRWRTLRQWLERRARQRALSEDEQRLLALATARTGNTRR
jgi:hypothetical protein